MIKTNKLHHGGIMANYRCTAACRHCLYACSPDRSDGYISREAAGKVCELLRIGGCRSIHIGGGEPFLDFDGLIMLIETVVKSGIRVEYIETNAFWVTDKSCAESWLKALYRAGADTLCISLDPFHAEYVPPELPLVLADICQRSGFGYFLWQERFLPLLSRLDKSKTHSRAELEVLISPRYILETARSYGLHMGGRAIGIELEYSPLRSTEEVVNDKPCRGLLSGDHFHVDMYGCYVPPGCTGIAVPLNDAVNGFPAGKYPVFEALLSGGSAALLRYATELGFTADEQGYTSGCALCFHLRRWLCDKAKPPELIREHYAESMKYW